MKIKSSLIRALGLPLTVQARQLNFYSGCLAELVIVVVCLFTSKWKVELWLCAIQSILLIILRKKINIFSFVEVKAVMINFEFNCT